MLKSSKDEHGIKKEQTRSIYLFAYFPSRPLITHVQSERPLEALWSFPSLILPF